MMQTRDFFKKWFPPLLLFVTLFNRQTVQISTSSSIRLQIPSDSELEKKDLDRVTTSTLTGPQCDCLVPARCRPAPRWTARSGTVQAQYQSLRHRKHLLPKTCTDHCKMGYGSHHTYVQLDFSILLWEFGNKHNDWYLFLFSKRFFYRLVHTRSCGWVHKYLRNMCWKHMWHLKKYSIKFNILFWKNNVHFIFLMLLSFCDKE